VTDPIRELLKDLTKPDNEVCQALEKRLADILRPSGALKRLDEIAIFMGGWQGSLTPRVERPKVLIFAADHGVATAGVSAYPSSVTESMMSAFEAGLSTINAFARIAGAEVTAVDVGIGRPTADIRLEPAMSEQRFFEALESGRQAVKDSDSDLLVLGEMGIGNTTSSAAISCALFGGDASDWVGRGTGIDEDGLRRKREAVEHAVKRIDGASPPEILRELGGAEIVAIAGAIIEARRRKIVVLLDGFVVAAGAAPLHACDPSALEHCIAAHQSAERGHRRLLDLFGLKPLLDLDFRLGEASGAAAVIPLISMACAAATQVPTFTEYFGPTA
jgi:nicotinate-nucleotide--dimethylbenzimidazole phosphoribosyltransferase|tara:strand:- start:2319 stop:3314 length:996 start_codon:yes stop_codon:yes gene_type:complete